MKNEKLWQLLLVLALIVIVSSFFTRHLTPSGTLYDYAQENPEIAYAENETEVESTEDESLCSYPTVDDMNESAHPERVTYAEGFFYEPITPEIETRIRGISYPEDDTDIEVSLSNLSYVSVLYNDFDGNVAQGELICNNSIAIMLDDEV